MKELDLLIGKWAETNVDSLEIAELERFESEVLHMETPDLYKILTGSRKNFDDYEIPKVHFLQDIKVYSELPTWNIST